MPVTKTAKRALRGSQRKADLNTIILSRLEIAIKKAKKTKAVEAVTAAMSLADRATKKNVFHKNKADRIKSQLSKLVKITPKAKVATKKAVTKTKAKSSKKVSK